MQQLCKLVMIVDDDSIDNFVAGKIILLTGFAQNLVAKNSVRDALTYLKENQYDGDKLPDLIFLDLNMPMYSGFDFLNSFEKLDKAILDKCKIIILSSSDNRPDIEYILEIDAVIKFITKPISEENLQEIRLNKVYY